MKPTCRCRSACAAPGRPKQARVPAGDRPMLASDEGLQ